MPGIRQRKPHHRRNILPDRKHLSTRCVRISAATDRLSSPAGDVLVTAATVSLGRLRIVDEDISTKVVPLLEETLVAPSRISWVALDLSENAITDEGIKTLTAWFFDHADSVRLRTIKLYKNVIGDEGASAIAHLIERHDWPVEEVHLSHNAISDAGASRLLQAFVRASTTAQPVPNCAHFMSSPARRYVYPRLDPGRQLQLPVWLRLEYNCVRDCEGVLLSAASAYSARTSSSESPPSSAESSKNKRKIVCFAERFNAPAMKDPNCSPKRCAKASRSLAPLFHLFSFSHQLAPKRFRGGGGGNESTLERSDTSVTAPPAAAARSVYIFVDGEAALAMAASKDDPPPLFSWRLLLQWCVRAVDPSTLDDVRVVLIRSAEMECHMQAESNTDWAVALEHCERLCLGPLSSRFGVVQRVDDGDTRFHLSVGLSLDESEVAQNEFLLSGSTVSTLDAALRMTPSRGEGNFLFLTANPTVVDFVHWLRANRPHASDEPSASTTTSTTTGSPAPVSPLDVTLLSAFDDALKRVMSETGEAPSPKQQASLFSSATILATLPLIERTPRLREQQLDTFVATPPNFQLDFPLYAARAASDAPLQPPSDRTFESLAAKPKPPSRPRETDYGSMMLSSQSTAEGIENALTSIHRLMHMLNRMRSILNGGVTEDLEGLTEGCMGLCRQAICSLEGTLSEATPHYFPQLVSTINTLIQRNQENSASSSADRCYAFY